MRSFSPRTNRAFRDINVDQFEEFG